MSRLDKLTARLRARTDREGKPLPGYRENVAALKAEIAMLAEQMDAVKEMGADNNGS